MNVLDMIQIFIPYACSEGSCLFSWENIQKKSDAFGGMLHDPATVASPYQDNDVLPVREITLFFSKSIPVHRNASRPPMGDWWRKRGAS